MSDRKVSPEENLSNIEQQFQQNIFKGVVAGRDIKVGNITQNITLILIKETGDRPPRVIEIDWRKICHQVLTQQQENQRLRRKATELGFELNVYVPLGLVERKQQQRRSASDDVEREEVYRLSEEVITKEYEHDAFLKEVIGVNSTDNKHVAIVGEPGAGKTTLLTKIADWIDKNELGLPIYISLANLQTKSLKDYLLKVWLEEALNCIDSEARIYQDAVRESLKERFRAGGVWLLLDGLDEMAVSSSTGALSTIQRQLLGWVAQARVALTSRLNVWDFSLNNPLANFQTYRTLEFSQEDVEQFIKDWFAAAKNELLGTRLQAKLEESQYQRVRELVKNPLRLALLCQTWYYNQGELPETRAGLYQRFVFYFPQWRFPEYPCSLRDDEKDDLIDELNIALGKLAKEAIDSPNRFRLPKNFCRQQMKLYSQEIANKKNISLFQLACDFGWLNLVDRDRETEEEVYAFFHPTFQEYFAATAVDDWDYFLPRSHRNQPVWGKKYGVFEPQWKEVILLWLGREDIDKEEKEKFIRALVEFEDGCGELLSQEERVDKGFYEYQAYFLAAEGIAEFRDCSRTDEIVNQIIKWGFGYLDEKQEPQKFLEVIEKEARKVLQETERTKAITALLKLLRSNHDDYRFISRDAIKSLGQIGIGNEMAINTLIEIIQSNENEFVRQEAFDSLENIGIGNETAISFLVHMLNNSINGEETQLRTAKCLGKIAPGNKEAINILEEKLWPVRLYEEALWQLADSLGRIDPGNKSSIDTLISLSWSTDISQFIRVQSAESLGSIAPSNSDAIAILSELIERTSLNKNSHQENLWRWADSLGKIDPGNATSINTLNELLELETVDDYVRWETIRSLGKWPLGNTTAITALVKVIRSTSKKVNRFIEATRNEDDLEFTAEDTPAGNDCLIAIESLGKVGIGNETAINTLIKIIETTQSDSVCLLAVDSLGKVGIGNETAINTLIKIIETTQSDSVRDAAIWYLRKVGIGNETAINTLIKIIETTQSDSVCQQAIDSLGKVGIGNEMAINTLIEIIEILKTFFRNKQFDEACYQGLWYCAHNMTYHTFYEAWHKDTVNTCTTKSLDLADLPQILTEEIAKDPELRDKVQLICIDGSKFIVSNNPASKIYTEIVKGGFSKSEDGTPKNMPELQAYWDLLEIESDECVVLVFYENPTGRKPQGFSEVFLNSLSAFDGAICVITEQPLDNIPLQWFTLNQTVEDVIAWIDQRVIST